MGLSTKSGQVTWEDCLLPGLFQSQLRQVGHTRGGSTGPEADGSKGKGETRHTEVGKIHPRAVGRSDTQLLGDPSTMDRPDTQRSVGPMAMERSPPEVVTGTSES